MHYDSPKSQDCSTCLWLRGSSILSGWFTGERLGVRMSIRLAALLAAPLLFLRSLSFPLLPRYFICYFSWLLLSFCTFLIASVSWLSKTFSPTSKISLLKMGPMLQSYDNLIFAYSINYSSVKQIKVFFNIAQFSYKQYLLLHAKLLRFYNQSSQNEF